MTISDGLRFTIPGAKFRRTLGAVSYPQLDGLEGLYYLGGSIEASVRNHGPSGPDAEEIGLLDVSDPYSMRVRGSDDQALNTGIFDTTNDLTMITVVRNVAAPVVLMGNLSGPRSDGTLGLMLNGTGQYQFLVTNPTQEVADLIMPGLGVSVGEPSFLAAVVSGETISLWRGAAGVLTKVTSPTSLARTRSAIPITIGRGQAGVLVTPQREFFQYQASIHKIAVADEHIARIYKFLQRFYGQRNIVI